MASALGDDRATRSDGFRPGDIFLGGPRLMGEKDLLFCTLWCGDGQPHSNEEYSRKTPFGRRILHGDAMFAVGAGLIHGRKEFAGRIAGFVSLTLKFPRPIFIGDSIGARLTVHEMVSQAEAAHDLLRARLEVLNETQGETAIIAEITYAMKRKM